MSWSVVASKEFEAWLKSISDEEAVAVATDVKVLEVFGPQLGRPHVDTLKASKHKNMKELRTGTIRTAFAFDPAQEAILLCAGDKAGVSSKKFYKQLIDKADGIFGAHLKKLKEAKKKKKSRDQKAKKKKKKKRNRKRKDK